MPTYYVDYLSGSDAADGLTFATRKRTITAASAIATAGDEIRVAESGHPISLGVSASWSNLTASLTLGSAVTTSVYRDGAWTASANVTCATSTTRKQGTNSATFVIAAGFTTGKIASYRLPSVLDLSSYQKISLFFLSSVSTPLGGLNLNLCSDLDGNTPVNTLSFSSSFTTGSSGVSGWSALTMDYGAALGNSIASLSLETTYDPGALTFQLDNILATNTLELGSLLGKNTPDEIWWAIRSIDGTTVFLDRGCNSSAGTTSRGYVGLTQTVETFYRNPIKLDLQTSTTTDHFTIGSSGTVDSPIVISGGWDSGSMSSITGHSFFNAINNYGEIFALASRSYITFRNLSGMNATNVYVLGGTGAGITFDNCHSLNSTAHGFNMVNYKDVTYISSSGIQNVANGLLGSGTIGTNTQVYNCKFLSNGGDGVNAAGMNDAFVTKTTASNNGGDGLEIATSNRVNYVDNEFSYNTSRGILISNCRKNFFTKTKIYKSGTGVLVNGGVSDLYFSELTTSLNTTAVSQGVFQGGDIYVHNWNRSESIAFSPLDYSNVQLISVRDSGIDNNHIVYTDGGRISSDATTRHTDSGISWKISPTSITTRGPSYPLTHTFGNVFCQTGVPLTASIWVLRTSASLSASFEVEPTTRLNVPFNYYETASITAPENTWQLLTASYLPNFTGILKFKLNAYGGIINSLYWDDFSITGSSNVTLDATSGDIGGLIEGGVFLYPSQSVAQSGGGQSVSLYFQ